MTLRTQSGDGYFGGLGSKLVTMAQVMAQVGHEVASVMINRAAAPTHEVDGIVGMGHFPPRGAFGPQFRLANQAELSEHLEGPVDRAQVDGYIGVVDFIKNFLSGPVLVAFGQYRPNRPPCVGHPVIAAAQMVFEIHPATILRTEAGPGLRRQ